MSPPLRICTDENANPKVVHTPSTVPLQNRKGPGQLSCHLVFSYGGNQ